MRRIVLGLAVVIGLLGSMSGAVSAHVLEVDKGISAVLHVAPDDNPLANKPTKLEFSFGDESNKLKLADCDCRVAVLAGGKTISTVPLKQQLGGSADSGQATVTFPSVDVYSLVVTGRPAANQFTPFKLVYVQRVASSANTSAGNKKNGAPVLIIGAGSLVLVGVLAYNSISFGGRYRKIETKL